MAARPLSTPICPRAGPRSHRPDTVVRRLVPSSPTGTIRPEMADLLTLRSRLTSLRPINGTRDAWVWCHSRFSVQTTYCILCGLEPPEDPQLLRRCRLVWKQRLPLKIRLFGWLLLRRRFFTRVLRRRKKPEAPVECPLCQQAHVTRGTCYIVCDDRGTCYKGPMPP